MARRIDLTLDCVDAPRLAEFWKLALGYEDEPPPAPFATRDEWVASFGEPADDDGGRGAWLHDPAGVGPRLTLLDVPEPKVAKNRLHVDLRIPATGEPEERWATILATVDELLAAGGTTLRVNDGHGVVLADPEGNELCVAFAKGATQGLDLCFDTVDALRLEEFWKLALGYEDEPPPAPFATRAEWVASFPDEDDEEGGGAWLRDPDGVGPRLCLLDVPEPKVAKNRLHLDVRIPAAGEPAERWATLLATVDELLAAGATELARYDGHHVVLADPEGNELCVAYEKAPG